MSIKRDLKEIKDSQLRLEKLYNGSILKKANDYDKLIETLKKVKFDKIKMKTSFDNYGSPTLIIDYVFEPITLRFDENKTLIVNDVFKAINELNLISIDDMTKIIKAIKSIESQKND
jgi:hypothetical protein